MAADLEEKLERLGRVAEKHGLQTLVLREPANLAWLLGARVHVPQTLETSCFDVVVHGLPAAPRLTFVANTIEAPRLRDTELAGIPADWQVVPWWDPRESALPRGSRTGSDRPAAGQEPFGEELASLRLTLTAHQQQILRAVCADTAAATTAAAHRIGPGSTEYAAAGLLAAELLERGLDPVVLMVAGDERIAAHRHPLPTHAPLGGRGMLVCCGRRDGLIGSVTRTVAFDSPPSSSGAGPTEAYDRLLRVEQAFLDATVPGACIGDVFARGTAAYAEHGFAPQEWHRHHQGGFTGFRPREFPAHTDSPQLLEAGQAIAWNPSGNGWKTEDTCLIGPHGPEPLAHDDAWPTVTVGSHPRPAVLHR